MLYSEYSRKITRLAAFLAAVRKYKIAIIATVATILAVIAVLLGTRGLVYDSVGCPAQIEYGCDFEYRAGAFLGDVTYEFCTVGSNEWTTEKPLRAGSYYVRAVSERTGGAKSFGKVYEFTIVPKPVDIAIADSVVFGELPEHSAELVYGDVFTVTKFEYADVSKTSTLVRADLDNVRAFDADGNDVTDSYEFRTEFGEISFIPREIEITVPSVTGEYDGKPLTSSAWELTGGSFADGDGLVTVFDRSQTDVGETENTPIVNVSRSILNGDGIDVTANYKITQKVGKLTVQKREVLVRTKDGSHVYDGTPFTCAEYEIAENYSLVGSDRLETVLTQSIVDAGEVDNKILFEVRNADGDDVTYNYSIVVDPGLLTVQKRTVGVKTANGEKIYDNRPLENRGYVLDGTLVDGHELKIERATSITNAGSVDNVLDGNVIAADGVTDESKNYELVWEYGKLTVQKRKVRIKTPSVEWTYDGKEHSATDISVVPYDDTENTGLVDAGNDAVDPQAFSIESYTRVVNVTRGDDGTPQSVENVIVVEIKGARQDYTENYEIEYVYGALTVVPREITVTTASHDWMYDGSEHSDNGLSVTVGTLADGESLVGESVSSIDKALFDDDGGIAGTPNVVTVTVMRADADVTYDYDVTVVFGELKIFKRYLTLKAMSDSKIYDGERFASELDGKAEHCGKIVDGKETGGLLDGHTVVTPYRDYNIVDAGSVDVEIDLERVVVRDVDDNDVTRFYDIECVKAQRTVSARPVAVMTGTAEWTYDGNTHFCDKFDILPDIKEPVVSLGMLDGHSLKIVGHTEVVDVKRGDDMSVQSYDNELTLAVAGTAQTNYAVSYIFGKLTVKPLPITVTTATDTWVYDGMPKSNNGFDITLGKLVDGHAASMLGNGTAPLINVGAVENRLQISVKKADGSLDLTHDYEISYVYGTWSVTKRTVRITTASATWEYDGKDHNNTSYYLTGNGDNEGFVLGHVLYEYKYPTVRDVMLDDEGNVVGCENVFTDCSVRNANGDQTTVGDKMFPNDNYELIFTFGTLTIERRSIAVAAGDTTRVYSGFEKYCDTVISVGTLADGQTGEPQFDGAGVNVGVYRSKLVGYKVYCDGDDVSRNYEIAVGNAEAKLEITKRPIVFVSYGTSDDNEEYQNSWMYDGTEKSLCRFGVKTRFLNGQPLPDEGHVFLRNDDGTLRTAHKYVGDNWASITDVGTCDNTFTVRIYHDSDNSVEITDNYDISYDYGTLIVYKRLLSLVANDASKLYDGEPLVCHEYRISGYGYPLVDGHSLVVEFSAESTLTEVGEIFNKISTVTVYDAAGKDVTANYDFYRQSGLLKVYTRKLVIVTDDLSKVYDGAPLVGGGARVAETGENNDGLADGHEIVWGSPSSITDVADSGEKNVVEIVKIVDGDGDDVTVNYIISEASYGTLNITPRQLVVTTASHEWEYDGIVHFDFGYELTDGTLVDGHKLSVIDYTKIRDVGKIMNVLLFAVMQGDVDLTGNYLILQERGVLSVVGDVEPDPPIDPDEPYAVMRIKSERTASLYLRAYSGGEYNGTTDWGIGNDYGGQTVNYDGSNYSVNYLASIVMQKSGMTEFVTEIDTLSYMTVLPYFTDIRSGHKFTGDVIYEAGSSKYSVRQYLYDYSSDNGAALVGTDLDIYRSVEAAYRRYVYDTYLSVPQSTAEFMNEVITAQRFKKDDPAVISKVARYVRTAAKYDLGYDTALDASGDVAVAFLRDYKAGVCRHYATSATLLYRALGIPARYTVGALGDAKAGEWVDVMSTSLHAWVEVYIDGVGWVYVEVTGGDVVGGGDDGSGGNGDGETSKARISIKPVDVVREYDGNEVFADQTVEDASPDVAMLALLIEQGFTYTAVVSGSRINYGVTESVITAFTLFDATGVDVTDDFEIVYSPGKIMITKTQILLHAPSYKRAYDGTPLKFDELFDGVYGYWWDFLPDGVANVTVDMSLYDGITDAGSVKATDLTMIFDELGACVVTSVDGDDITENYTVVFVDGGLTVTPRELIITAGSDEKAFDGEPLTCDSYEITLGSLVDGHVLTVTLSGSIVDIGEESNNVLSATVVDADGNDVSGNYRFKVIKGTLTVT